MFLDDNNQKKNLARWIIGIVASCILIFLGIRYISVIAFAIQWIAELVMPLLLGVIFALIIDVPMHLLESHLFVKNPTEKKEKMRRPMAIFLSLALIFGIFIGISVLVIPELVEAVTIIATSLMSGMDQMAMFESMVDFSKIPFGEQLSQIDIDWMQLKSSLDQWLEAMGTSVMDRAADILGKVASSTVEGAIGLVFSIYILSNKEKLKQQVSRLIHVWLPKEFGACLIHVSSVCSSTFRMFIAGQTVEAMILGSLCFVGMMILRIPYAPIIGTLVGVTALIPYVGAWIAMIVGAFMIFTVNPFKALMFVIFLLALQQVEGNLIYPRVVGAKMNLPAMWVLAAITIGSNLAGPIGMLLGVPAFSAAYALIKEATDKREASEKQESGEPLSR